MFPYILVIVGQYAVFVFAPHADANQRISLVFTVLSACQFV